MNKALEIMKAWAISFHPNNEQAKLAQARIEVCHECPHIKDSPYVHCGLCGCPLQGKIYTPVKGSCLDGRWVE
jgi:uncharacterized paraquat-inducible protein A